ncbi:glycosyl hydrolase 115 family protein [uncultured Bacteroides sp.]|uniref:glycosyl hydrolase 115 family protein n=1 Tax=uncultured Bacteroides sp. TaxID=162156 RepID=UPI002AAB88A4|nr:glycosyl hydrolase 115 family protein [uncultured Bacteroides sp.]
MKHIFRPFLLFICFESTLYSTAFAGNYSLISQGKSTSLYLNRSENTVVQTATNLFISDMTEVSGNKPTEISTLDNASIIVATLGKSKEIDQWLRKNNVSAKEIVNQWEAFKIQVVQRNDSPCLVVLGSNARGTAYGVLELSRIIGVSPWCWWADATPSKKNTLTLPEGYVNVQQPSVQYRGIFLNDEDWGLMPWSSKNFEQTAVKGQIGPKTYAKIFELLLRLRANTIWPAMHECTVPFYFVNGTKEMADKYGIVMATSHCEPLMRNSAGEWDVKKYGEYNYLTNKEAITSYWTERLKNVGQSENIYTIGMRGVHDGQMQGVKTLEEHTTALTNVFKDQRELLAKYVNPDVTKVPQVFVPYKEVLNVYNNGLKVPDDVTLMWCDDNYGYITRLSNEQERKRKGGAGVYYHISYWGRPHDYLWLCSTQPSLIYTEMKRAWDYGARKLWILNVGDIKPAEYDIEFFMDLAWSVNGVQPNTISQHLDNWLTREFGNEVGQELTPLMNKYYQLADIRKPEFMGWSRVEEASVKGGKTPVIDSEFNPFAFGDELQKRANEYATLSERVKEIAKKIPAEQQDVYFELVQYPVCGAAAMNQKHLYAQKARLFAKYNLLVANEYSFLSDHAYNEIVGLTQTYNHDIQKAKWNGMMDMKPRQLPVFQYPSLPEKVTPQQEASALVWIEGDSIPLQSKHEANLISLVRGAGNQTFISLFSRSNKPIEWKVEKAPSWLKIEEQDNGMRFENRLIIRADLAKVNRDCQDELLLSVDGEKYPFNIQAKNLAPGIMTEANGMIAWNAADYKSATKGTQVIEGLGHSTKAVSLPKYGELTYEVYTTTSGEAAIRIALIPNHPVNGGSIRYSVSVDNEKPQVVAYETGFRSEPWKINVLRNQSLNTTLHKINIPGKHTIRISALDPEVIVDQLMLDFNKDRKFYKIPIESSNNE